MYLHRTLHTTYSGRIGLTTNTKTYHR